MQTKTYRKKNKIGRLIWFILGAFGWLFGAIALLGLSTSWWLPRTLEWINRDGSLWDKLDFQISHFDSRQLKIENVRFQKDNIEVNANGISLHYHPRSLFRTKQFDSILLDPLKITIDLEMPLAQAQIPEEAKTTPILFPDLSTTIPLLPFQEFFSGTIDVDLKKGAQSILTPQLMLDATNRDGEMIARAEIKLVEDSIHLESRLSLSDGKNRSASATAHFWDPMNLLSQIKPLLPETTVSALEASGVQLGPVYASVDWMGSEERIASRLIVSGLGIADQFSIDTLLLDVETTEALTCLDGTLSTDILHVSNTGDTRIEGSFHIDHPLSTSPSFTSSWSIAPFIAVSKNGTDMQLCDEMNATLQYAENRIKIDLPQLHSPLAPLTIREAHAEIDLPTIQTPEYQFRSQWLLVPELINPDYQVTALDPSDPISLTFEGSVEEKIRGLESLQSRLNLRLPKHSVQSTLKIENQPEIEFSAIISGEIQGTQQASSAATEAKLSLEQIHLKQSTLLSLSAHAELEAQAATDLQFDQPGYVFDPFRDLKESVFKLDFEAQGSYAQSKFQAKQVRVTTPLPDPVQHAPGEQPFEIHSEFLKWDAYKVIQPTVSGWFSREMLQLHIEAGVLDQALRLRGDAQSNWINGTHKGAFTIQREDPLARTTLSLNELLPDIPTTILSAVISASMQVVADHDNMKIAFSAGIQDGKVTIPDSGVSIEGIQLLNCAFEDVLIGQSTDTITVKVGSIDYAPSHISDVQCTFKVESGYTITVQDMQFRFCDGSFKVEFKKPIAAPYDSLSFRVEFQGMDIKQLTDLIPDFKENLTGKMDGFLPFKIEKGQIAWGKGSAYLSKGTTARLQYAENGLFASYIPEIVISKKLDIDINKALRDIILTELTVEIQSSTKFDQPTVVIMSGHSNNSKIEIPIERIQLNIRAGDIPGLLNQSFNSKKWIETLLFRNKM